jgi:PAT family beta-lactamase induction signal transducer AmpG
MNRPILRLYANRRMAALVGLGFASGVPLMLTGRTMRLWARDQGVDLASVGLIGLVTLPYAYKFLWAPLLDRFDPPVMDRRRGWVLIFQLLLLVAIVMMGLVGPASGETDLRMFVALAAVIAVLSASQDIVSDAYRTDVLSPAEYGAGASVYTTGYRLAMLATGAGAVWLASTLPWSQVYLIAGLTMVVGVIATLFAPTPAYEARPPSTFANAVVEPVREFVTRNGRRAIVIIAFILVFKLPDYMASAMTDAMLLDLGYTKEQISIWSLGAGTAVTIPGALIGGVILTRFGLKRSLFALCAAQALSNAGYLALARLQAPHETAMLIVVAIEYFCVGLVAAGFMAFLMKQCNHRFSATQYALLSSAMGLSNSLGGAPAGFLVERAGYEWFFAITILLAIPGLLLLPWVHGRLVQPTAAETTLAST